MKTLLFFLFASYVSYGQIGSGSPAVECDPFVRKELDAQGIEYSVDKDGDFKIVQKLEGGRTQIVFIQSQSMNYRDITVRRIWSYARVYNTRTDISEANIYTALSKNATYKFGAWQIGKDNGGKYYLNFSVRAATDARGKDLKDIIGVVAMSGDEVEKEFTNTDNH